MDISERQGVFLVYHIAFRNSYSLLIHDDGRRKVSHVPVCASHIIKALEFVMYSSMLLKIVIQTVDSAIRFMTDKQFVFNLILDKFEAHLLIFVKVAGVYMGNLL